MEPRSGDRRWAWLVALAAFLVYNANLRGIAIGDTFPARFVPLAVLHRGTVYLDDLLAATRMGYDASYWVVRAPNGRWASAYPLVTPLLATPLYLPAALYLDLESGWDDVGTVERAGEVMEKVAASALAAASAGLMFWLLRRRMSRPRALLLAAAFALGTETWAISSQALWQHGTAELLLVVALLAATGPPTARSLLLAGLAAGLAIANRPPDAPLAAAFAVYAPFWARPARRSLIFFAAAAVPLALTLAYDLACFHNLDGGYGYIIQRSVGYARFFRFPVGPGLAAQLVSPGKGLFVYSPFLLFLPLGFRLARRIPAGDRLLSALLVAGMVVELVLYARSDFRGGQSYGPRFLTDMVPLLVWLLAPVVEALRGAGLAAFAAACLFSVYVQAVGAFLYPGAGSDQLYYAGGDDDLSGVWRPGNAAFLVELRSGLRSHRTFLDLGPGPPARP